MPDHDGAYKRFFSQPEMVAALLRLLERPKWISDLDLSTLERVNAAFVDEKLQQRYSDLLWRVRRTEDGQWHFVYFLLELQSTVDRYMALRLNVYVALFYQDLIRQNMLTPGGELPPLLALVVYNGLRPWLAPVEVFELIKSIPGEQKCHFLQLEYVLLDTHRIAREEQRPSENLALALFRLEACRNLGELKHNLDQLIRLLATPEKAPLRRAFASWLTQVLLPSRFPGLQVTQVKELMEIKSMLAETVHEWTMQWKQEGIQQGLDEGRKLGLKKGKRIAEESFLLRLLESRFGPVPHEFRTRIALAESDRLLHWGERLLTAASLEEVLR